MQPQSISLSIIVPVYNNSRDLKECLSAIKAASLPNTEIIIVDDASTDDTFPTASGWLGENGETGHVIGQLWEKALKKLA